MLLKSTELESAIESCSRATVAKQRNVKTTIKNLHVNETTPNNDDIIGPDISLKTKFKTSFNLLYLDYLMSKSMVSSSREEHNKYYRKVPTHIIILL
ncbi:hypothetical protein T11_13269 [Trichinella zimbabwensis]|uniref:PiggyBac transposable element-derived protein domain-containing protein n=1 Tax=Trichinella zimbabwensis TaxID=268475 RepID=A0A0V1HG16_9BILA|nr:hypothetical protein T11_13269 [Trichinella zimbabwensis]